MRKNLTFGIIVKNYDETIEFYTTKLGFAVAEDIPMGDDRWVTLTAPGNTDTLIALHIAQDQFDEAIIGKQGGSYPFFGIVVDDCKAEYKRMKKLGVKFDGEPKVTPYGVGVTLEDPYGNKIYMNQEPKN
jgi:catechol 2,3-dioxygenase-like lactoylglutathione lyase family enzyme